MENKSQEPLTESRSENDSDEANEKRRNLIFSVVLIALIIVLIAAVYNTLTTSHDSVTSIICEANIEKILETSQLSTLEYTYNGIAVVNKQYFDSPKYYVAYEGIVQAGMDFSEITVSVDDQSKIITIKLPEVSILSTSPREKTLSFLFLDELYETETVFSEAYSACVMDLQTRAKSETTLFNLARENAKSAVTALISPWVSAIDKSFTVEII